MKTKMMPELPFSISDNFQLKWSSWKKIWPLTRSGLTHNVESVCEEGMFPTPGAVIDSDLGIQVGQLEVVQDNNITLKVSHHPRQTEQTPNLNSLLFKVMFITLLKTFYILKHQLQRFHK